MKKFFALLISICIVSATVLGLRSALQFHTQAQDYWQKTDPQELNDIGSPYKLYYSRLDNTGKHTYNAILSEIFSMPEHIKIPNIDGFELEEIFSALLNDNPELFFLSRVCSLEDHSLKYDRFVPQYSMSASEYEQRAKQLNRVVAAVEAGYSARGDKWQTELEIHDYIVKNCEYLLNSDSGDDFTSSAYGALVEGKASCEGYSKAMKLLLDRAGIKNAVVSGEATNIDGETVNHMWNAVFVGGGWYYVDSTWDDPVSADENGIYGHTYFNVSSKMLSTTHSDFSYDFDCSGISENYHVRRGQYFEQYDRSCEKRMSDIIVSQLDAGIGRVEIRFANKEVYDKAINELFESNDRGIDRVLYSAMEKTKVDFSEYFKYVPDDFQYVLTLVISIEEKNYG